MKLFWGKVTFILALIMIMTGSGFAKKLTLNDCIDLALKNRASIIRAQGSEQLAKASQRSALGAFLPNLSVSYNYSKGRETSISPPYSVATGYEPSIDTFVV
ncbi:MAG: TolC family protein, partial [FCB group bacterium]|nr:TolC family protein [FCB group bacterium]